jgi:YfiH family protein
LSARLTFFTTGTRHGNVRAPGALVRLLKSKKLPTAVATAEQVHGPSVVVVPALKSPRKFSSADGLLTQESGQPLAIFTADCVPIFVDAGAGRVVGILHAGWRGVRGRILTKAVRLLKKRWGLRPREIRVWAGPAIGPCCFEVQWDVARHFAQARRRYRDRWSVDLLKALKREARMLGVRWVVQKALQGCTMHRSQYHSYRRDKTDQRQASVIMK